MQCRDWAKVAIGLVFTAATARGHTLLMTRGEAVIHTDHIAIELQLAAEDLLHWQSISLQADGAIPLVSLREAAERHATTLHDVFVIRDALGNRLVCKPYDTELPWRGEGGIDLHELRKLQATYNSTCAYAAAPRFLTFHLMMRGADIGIHWQVVLAVRGDGESHPQAIRLTSRGNVETIQIAWAGEGAEVFPQHVDGPECEACDRRGTAWLKELCADIVIQNDDVYVQLSIPLPLLNTWISLPSRDGEFLNRAEQDSVMEAASALVAGAFTVELDGRPLPAEVVQLRLVPLTGSAPRLSLWTGRLAADLRFRSKSTLKQPGMRWKLFNNAVVTGKAAIRNDRSCLEHEFTTYQPLFEWPLVPAKE
jgi:hypothetical protein